MFAILQELVMTEKFKMKSFEGGFEGEKHAFKRAEIETETHQKC